MLTRKPEAGVDKENGTERNKDVEMTDAKKKAGNKRETIVKAGQHPKKARKHTAADDQPSALAARQVGSGRQAAQNLDFQDRPTSQRQNKEDLLAVKEDIRAESELTALVDTQGGMPSVKSRRLGDFSVFASDGSCEPIETVAIASNEFYFSGIVYPRDGAANKATGRRVEKLGPLRSFSLELDGKNAVVVLHTDMASYTLLRPSVAYKKTFINLAGQADIVYEVYQMLSPQHGGSAFVSFEEVVAGLARSKVVRGFSTPREGLLVNGKFVLAQLACIDESSGSKAVKYASTEFAKSLAEALADFKYVGAQAAAAAASRGGIVIRDPVAAKQNGGNSNDSAATDGPPTAQMEADEEFARQLQAKIDGEMRHNGRSGPPKSSQAYIKVSEAEIADDYPPPIPYNKEEEETDELLLAEEDMLDVDPEYLPRRVLTDFSIYNAEGLLATLELLPMASGVDADVELYASGVVVDDDGDFSGAQKLDGATADVGEAGGSSGSAGGSSSPAGGAAAPTEPAGMRMYLSQIREWVVEVGADMLFITLRTDVAWYRLAQPASCYAPWFATVLRCARVAATVLGMLSEESRASKVSFADVVKRLSKQPEDAPTFVSKRPAAAERFLAVHAQIIISCFQHYPVQTVRKSAFVSQLKERMAMVRHSKLYASAGKTGKLRGVNRNPMKDRAAGARSKPMTATATTMVKSIWQAYFIAVPALATDQEPKDDGVAAAAADGVAAGVATCIGAGGSGTVAQDVGGLAREIEDDINEEENEEDVAEDALAGNPTSRSPLSKKNKKSKTDAAAAEGKSSAAKNSQGSVKVTWSGAATVGRGGIKIYAAVKVNDVTINAGDAVELMPQVDSDSDQDENEIEDDDEDPAGTELGLVQAMWQDASGGKWVQLRCMVRGVETVLGDAASSSELFLTDELETRPLSAVIGGISAKRMDRPWDSSRREEYFKIDAELRARNEVAAQEGRPLELFWRRQYVPEEGMFRDVPVELQLGTRLEEPSEPETGVRALEDGTGFIKDGMTYKIGDFLFVAPDVFDQMPEATRDVQLPEYLANSRFHKGSYAGLRAWGVGRLVKLGAAASKKATRDAKSKLSSITVTRYWRPEDISEDCAYTSESYHDVYASEETVTVDLEDVVRPVSVVPTGHGVPLDIDVFQCIGSFARSSKSFGPVPADLAVPEHLKVKCKRSAQDGMDAGATTAAKGKGKGKAAADDAAAAAAALTAAKGKGKASVAEAFSGGKFPGENGVALATMDIFAGCGGLSEGMHQAGAAYTRWAIEYESPAAEAFKVNNPLASVFCNNCNVLLHAAMAKAGMESDCLASEEAVQQSKSLPAADHAALPLPGEVDFICGGPPCQGYSGMNRFNKGNWSMVQNSMVMAFLSYADFYRPRYFLLENVRNFVSHNKSFTFRLTLRSLLDMGYQVRFGVLNAGNFGVAQSRKRTFIWAAAPGEHLPDWPRLMHCFRTPQLCINLPGGVQYTAVRQTVGAPLRPITVRDAIGDLPSIHNGADVDEMDYSGGPQSAFQRTVRGDCSRLTDHISKQMNELNLERCRCIPINCPGADWRILEDIVRKDPSKEKFKGQPLVPWCLPNTADRHNGWRGLFGRLDWMGHFPTSTTDPQPMGKVGQVFHPEQHRIVSVRECARAQGFPDRHRFYGNVHSKHRQVGNAVPPPLAAALGRQLRKALEEKAAEDAAALLRAQM